MFFIERIISRRYAPIQMDNRDERYTLSDNRLMLTALNHADADAFFELYSRIGMHNHFERYPIQSHETPESFAQRIVSTCEMIWAIRLNNDPAKFIGDCALHHWDTKNNEMEFGGSLFPEYWGQCIMAAALHLVAAFAKNAYGVKTLKCTVSTANKRALRFAEKMRFQETSLSPSTVSLTKIL